MTKIFSILLISCLLIACKATKNANSTEMNELIKLMVGSFDNKLQAKKDSSYHNIRLKMYPIWKEKKGEHWLYVEQAMSSAPNQPYRQRVYCVKSLGKDLFESAVYTLPSPKRFAGKWNEPAFFNIITSDSLVLRDGCSVYLRKVSSKYYRGATKEGTCESSLNGAATATSEVEVFEDRIISWDRGFDDEGKQVWGTEKGGYVFKKE
ncbi:MAG: chromophore lyase CpcT/CpeT [Saprospiraceae bacterium]